MCRRLACRVGAIKVVVQLLDAVALYDDVVLPEGQRKLLGCPQRLPVTTVQYRVIVARRRSEHRSVLALSVGLDLH